MCIDCVSDVKGSNKTMGMGKRALSDDSLGWEDFLNDSSLVAKRWVSPRTGGPSTQGFIVHTGRCNLLVRV